MINSYDTTVERNVLLLYHTLPANVTCALPRDLPLCDVLAVISHCCAGTLTFIHFNVETFYAQ